MSIVLAALAVAVAVPQPPVGAAEGEVVEIDGAFWLVQDGTLVLLEDHEVTVTGSRVDLPARIVPVDVIGEDDLRERGARTLGDALQAEAGLQVNGALGLGQELQLDGLDGRLVLVLVDGRPVTGRVNNRIDVSRLPVSASSIERIEVVRGPMSALYGSEALGGVVNIITKRPSLVPSFELELGADVVTGGVGSFIGLHGSGGAGPVALRVDLTAADAPALDRGGAATGLVPDGKTDVPARRLWGVHAEAAMPLVGDDVSFRAQVDGAANHSLARTGGAAVPAADRARSEEWSAAALVEADVLDDATLAVDLRIDRYGHVFDKLPDGGERAVATTFCSVGGDGVPFDRACPAAPAVRTETVQTEARLELRYTDPLTPTVAASVGAVVLRQQLHREDGDGTDTIPGGGQRDVASAYGELAWQPWPWLAFLPGARVDAFAPSVEGRGAAVGPKIAARVDGPWHTALRASYGRGFRLPSFEERFLAFDHSELGYVVNGNAGLLPEQSHGVRAALSWDPMDKVSVGVEAYLNLLEDLITESVTGEDADGVPVFTYENAARAYTSGVTVRTSLGPFAGVSLDASYQYLLNAVDASACPAANPYFCSAAEGARSLPLRAAHSLDATVRWRLAATGTTLWLRADATSERPVDPDVIAPGFVVVGAGVRQPVLDRAELIVGVDDLLDAYDPVFGPKPGRRATVQLRVRTD